MSYSQAWLESPTSIKRIFIEVQVYNVITTQTENLYLSNTAYATNDSSIIFNPIVRGGVTVSQSLNITSFQASITDGDIELENNMGEYDNWLDSTKYIWYNRPIKVYLGDPFWTSTDWSNFLTKFKLIFNGIVADIDSKGIYSLNIKLRDRLQKLNTSITESTMDGLGDLSTTEDLSTTMRPIILGEVYNISPKLIQPGNLKYCLHGGTIEDIIEIRDNAVPLYTTGIGWYYNTIPPTGVIDLTESSFSLVSQPAGTITCSVQGDKRSINLTSGALETSYVNNVPSIIALILTQYGTVDSKITSADIDLLNFASVAIDRYQAVGIYITSRENILTICSGLAASIGAQLLTDLEGKVQLLTLGIYNTLGVTISSITEDDMLAGSFEISYRTGITGATKLGYCKTWSTQAGLLTAIPEDHKSLFNDTVEYAKAVDTNICTLYKLPTEVEPRDTYLINKAEAEAEATRINNYYKVPHTVYKFKGFANLFPLKLGQQVSLTHNRFGLSSGKTGQVVSLEYDWINSYITVGVII
jgi:hypothetical protein